MEVENRLAKTLLERRLFWPIKQHNVLADFLMRGSKRSSQRSRHLFWGVIASLERGVSTLRRRLGEGSGRGTGRGRGRGRYSRSRMLSRAPSRRGRTRGKRGNIVLAERASARAGVVSPLFAQEAHQYAITFAQGLMGPIAFPVVASRQVSLTALSTYHRVLRRWALCCEVAQ